MGRMLRLRAGATEGRIGAAHCASLSHSFSVPTCWAFEGNLKAQSRREAPKRFALTYHRAKNHPHGMGGCVFEASTHSSVTLAIIGRAFGTYRSSLQR